MESAVSIKICLIWDGVSSGLMALSRPATPVTMGAEAEVSPKNSSYSLPGFGAYTSDAGAAIFTAFPDGDPTKRFLPSEARPPAVMTFDKSLPKLAGKEQSASSEVIEPGKVSPAATTKRVLKYESN